MSLPSDPLTNLPLNLTNLSLNPNNLSLNPIDPETSVELVRPNIIERRNLEDEDPEERAESVTLDNLLDNLPLPPPIVKITEALDPNNPNVGLPGEIKISKGGQLLRNYLVYSGFGADIIESYNYAITRRVPERVQSEVIVLPETNEYPYPTHVAFTQVSYVKPKIASSVAGVTGNDMTPAMAREQSYTYAATIAVDMERINSRTGQVLERMERVRLGAIPVMLGSVLDHLTGLSDEQRVRLGECTYEPNAYFIINGVEYVILIQEHLRFNRIVVFNADSKGNPVCQMKCNTLKGQKIITLTFDPKKFVVGLKLNLFRDNSINLFQVYRMLGELDPQKIFARILQFVSSNHARKVWLNLQPTLVDLSRVSDDFGYLANLRKETSLPINALKDNYLIKLREELFPQIPIGDLERKLNLLSLMVARYVEHLAGLRPLDDRDSWSLKQMDPAGFQIDKLFGQIFRKMISASGLRPGRKDTSIEGTINEIMKRHGRINLQTIAKAIKSDDMLEQFTKAYTSHSWIASGMNSDGANVSEPLKHDNLISAYSHINRISTPTDNKSKNPSIRVVHNSQLGYIDPAETSEGGTCITKDHRVLLDDGIDSILIGEVGQNKVMTFNPQSLDKSPSSICNYFEYHTGQRGVPLYKLTTISGRTIRATGDHPFLTHTGWTKLEDIDPREDVVGIAYMPKYYPHEVEDRIILDENIFREICDDLKNSIMESHINDLRNRNFLPLHSTDKRLPIMARILGFLFTDGTANIYNGVTHSGMLFGTMRDAEDFNKDVQRLGFNPAKITEKFSTIIDKETGRQANHHTYSVMNGGSFVSLFIALGTIRGRKVLNQSIIPTWIVNGSLSVKREFLSGFQGGDGGAIRWEKRKGKPRAYSIQLHSTARSCNLAGKENMIRFMESMKALFAEFDIEITSIGECIPKEEDRIQLLLNISDKLENIIKYMERIGYRYANTKLEKGIQAYEFFRYKNEKIDERKLLKEKILTMYHGGMKMNEIGDRLNIRYNLINSIIDYYRHNDNSATLAPKDTLTIEEFLEKNIIRNGIIFVEIKSIEIVENDYVADFTTISDNHSFIADSFCVKNCGILKNKSVSCWISIPRSETVIRSYLEGRIFNRPTSVTPNSMILNGDFLGWCAGFEMQEYLRSLKRSAVLPKDIAIVLDKENVLWINSDGSRPTRPLLIVDGTELVIAKKNLWGSSFDVLIREGAVEYIDSWEQEFILLAMSIDDLKAKLEDIDDMIVSLSNAQILLARQSGRFFPVLEANLPNIVDRSATKDIIDERITTVNNEMAIVQGQIQTQQDELDARTAPQTLAILQDEAEKNLEEQLVRRKRELEEQNRQLISQRSALEAEQVAISALPEGPDKAERLTRWQATVITFVNDNSRNIQEYNENSAQRQNMTVLKEEAKMSVIARNLEISRGIRTLKDRLRRLADTIRYLEALISALMSPAKDVGERIFDPEELEREVASIAAILNRNYGKRFYTHCEMDPNALFGISASLLPLPNTCPGPRATFACVPPHTLVNTGLKRVPIGELKDGDTVLTINPVTLEKSLSKIKNYFTVSARSLGKKLLKITTYSGRVIEATDDHKMLTLHGWIEAGRLDRAMHHIGLHPTPNDVSDANDDDILFSIEDAGRIMHEKGIKESVIRQYVTELTLMGLLPLNSMHPNLPIIARLFGMLSTDGNTTEPGEDRHIRCKVDLGRPYDAELFNQDMRYLGWKTNEPKITHRYIQEYNTTYTTWVVHKSGSFAAFFIMLGIHGGNKVELPSTPVPDWIMQGSLLVKREFLAGYMGGDGPKVHTFDREYITKTGNAYGIGRIPRHKHPNHVESGIAYFKQLQSLFDDFDVSDTKLKVTAESGTRVRLELFFMEGRETILKLMDNVGYRYATTKNSDSIRISEWLRYVEAEKEREHQKHVYAHDLHHNKKWKHKDIAALMGIKIHQSEDYCRNIRDGVKANLSAKSIRLEEWLVNVKHGNDCIFEPIASIQEVEGDMVCDFETESPNHSFVAGDDFIVSNCNMVRQALGTYSSMHGYRMDSEDRRLLAYPTRPLFETQMQEVVGLNDLPAGTMVNFAIMTYMGFNQEDSIIVKKEAIERGLLHFLVYKTYSAMESKRVGEGVEVVERIQRPMVTTNRPPGAYDNLDERGIAKIGSTIRIGQCIIGRVRVIKEQKGDNITERTEDASVYASKIDEGIVDRVLDARKASDRVVKVKIRQVMAPVQGDKLASRSAQKSTIGLIVPARDLPFDERTGEVPDIIMNPHAIPSRMTISQLIEVIASKHGALVGERVNATAFQRFDLDSFKRTLRSYGYNPSGKVKMRLGTTGRELYNEVFTGPCYYQVLRHLVREKIQARGLGTIKADTRQPIHGKKHGGGYLIASVRNKILASPSHKGRHIQIQGENQKFLILSY